MDIKISKAQLPKIIQLFQTIHLFTGNNSVKVAVPLAKHVLAPLAMRSTFSKDYANQRKMRRTGVVRSEIGITLAISNEDLDDIIKIIESLENLSIWINGQSFS